MRIFFFLTIIVCNSLIGVAQERNLAKDTIYMLNGKIFIGKISSPDSSIVTIETNKKLSKIKRIRAEDIFCLQFASGKSDTFYYQDEALDNHLTTEQMWLFILGEQDAYKYYKSPVTSIIGAAIGTTAGVLLYDQFWIASIPVAYTIIGGTSQIKIPNIGFREPQLLATPAYQEGFIKVARTKKAFRALISSVAGCVLGISIGYASN